MVVGAGVVVALVAFVAMEPITALTHRYVMHGLGRRLHVSHHDRKTSRFEANDLYPLLFAALTMLVMAVGFQLKGHALLVPATVGISVYGCCYGFVHEVYIHRRLPFPWRTVGLEQLKDAHRIHHLWSAAPFGMLCPVVPGRLRRRAAARTGTHDPFAGGDSPVTLA